MLGHKCRHRPGASPSVPEWDGAGEPVSIAGRPRYSGINRSHAAIRSQSGELGGCPRLENLAPPSRPHTPSARCSSRHGPALPAPLGSLPLPVGGDNVNVNASVNVNVTGSAAIDGPSSTSTLEPDFPHVFPLLAGGMNTASRGPPASATGQQKKGLRFITNHGQPHTKRRRISSA